MEREGCAEAARAVASNGRPGSRRCPLDMPAGQGHAHEVVSTSERWMLRWRDQDVGTILVERTDMPWLFGRWAPAEAFEGLTELFADDLRLFQSGNWPAWERVHQRIVQRGVALHRPNGDQVAEWILHIDGNEAWFRFMDEAFD